MTQFNQMQTIKRRFFAMRNGIIADTLRKSGAPYRMIFGLNLPQVAEIAASLGEDAALAESLHADTATRESQLLAPMVMPVAALDAEGAMRWLHESPAIEATDIMCHRLLRRHPLAWEIVERCMNPDDDTLHYAGLRLMWNLIPQQPDRMRSLAAAETERKNPATLDLATRLIEELDFLAGE